MGLVEGKDGTQVIINPGAEAAQNIYKLMVGLIVPRPIAFVSSLSADGVPNLAPFSFFTAVSADPPVICFAPMIRGKDATRKDTLNNIEATGEFVVSIVSEEFGEQMNACSGEYPPEVDEFKVSRLTPTPSEIVKPPRVAEAKASMECRLVQVVHVSPKKLGGSLVLGEVLRFHVNDAIVDSFRIDADKLNAIGRMGGPTYVRTRDRFDMIRPT